jgi:hypothetical protein
MRLMPPVSPLAERFDGSALTAKTRFNTGKAVAIA